MHRKRLRAIFGVLLIFSALASDDEALTRTNMKRKFSRKAARSHRRRLNDGFAFAALCLLLAAFCLTTTIILTAQNANQSPTPPTAKPSPTPQTASTLTSPTPTPTPISPSNLHQWGAVTLFHGLPSNRVRAIAQDAEGAMWFGTDGGLARYDGRRTQTLSLEGLMSKRVMALKLDADGVLWVGTETGAGLLFNGEFRVIQETLGKAVTSIITPERGRAILASEEGIIFDCRKGADLSLNIKTIPEKPLESADFERPGPLNLTSMALKENVLYVGTRSRGVITIENNVVTEIRSTPRPYFVETIEMDARGRLWYGAKAKAEESGLYQAGEALHPVRTGTGMGMVTALRAGVDDDIWVGTDGRGAFQYDNSSRLKERFTFEETAGGLRSDHVYAIFIDREEVVWFGTDRGVCRYDPHAPRVENVSAVAESNFVRTLFQTTNGQLLAGTNRGLFSYDRAASLWSPVQNLSQSPVYAIAEDKRGRVLVGSGVGLYRSERATNLSLTRIGAAGAGGVLVNGEVSDSVRALAEFQGEIYVGTFGRGLERLDGGSRTLVWPGSKADAQEREVVSLRVDRSGRLWIGTALAGVFVFDGREVKAVPALEKLKGSAVWSIDDGGDDHIWFASARGLYLYQAGELKEVVQGLDARSVLATPDGSASASVWCATAGGGLLRVLMSAQSGAVVSRLDAEQGLPSQSAFAVLPVRAEKDKDETLLIGTNRGVARYSPGRVAPVLNPTRIIGQRIHQLSELKGGLHLEYPQNSLLLDVAATSSRTYPEQFQYAFLLMDTSGRVIKQKFSHDSQFPMESLEAGNYKVTASVFSKDLVASAPLTFEFRVTGAPFPWTTAALSVLLALALVALWWGYHQNKRLARTGATLADTIHQLANARMQLANETEAERRRIARDLHDQTLADLRHLLMLTDQLPSNGNEARSAPPATPAVFRSEIEAISNEIRRICEDLSPSVLENVGFSAALEWALANAVTHSPVERKFEYEFVAEEGLDERLNISRATQMQIYRIVQEAISNLSRHAAATRASLFVRTSHAGEFLLTLEDDGRDFDPHDRKIKQGRGLANMRARASLIEAEVSWKKRKGGGTQFTLRKANAVRISAAETED
jgi:ligand-binding sensor domain-containing protein/two-component sensor histidine kinase